MITSVEQDYILALYKEDSDIVSFKRLTNLFKVSGCTVNQTCRRLEEKDMVRTFPYQGVSLTTKGIKHAEYIMNTHRIWEYFLVNKLGMDIDQVHQEADKLEHVTSPALLEALYDFLGKPAYCPHGQKINLKITHHKHKMKLVDVADNVRVQVVDANQFSPIINDLCLTHEPQFITILKRYDNGDCLIIDQTHQRMIIPLEIVKTIEVLG